MPLLLWGILVGGSATVLLFGDLKRLILISTVVGVGVYAYRKAQ